MKRFVYLPLFLALIVLLVVSASAFVPAGQGRADILSNQPAFSIAQVDLSIFEDPLREIDFAAPLALFSTFLGKIISFISLFVLGVLLLLFIPKAFERFNARLIKTLGYSAGTGAIVFFGIPIALIILFLISVFLFITVLGGGVGIILLASTTILGILFGILVYVSSIFVAYLLGVTILSKASLDFGKFGWKVIAFLLGLVILSVAFAIPFVGWVVRIAQILFGVGGLSLILKGWIPAKKVQ